MNHTGQVYTRPWGTYQTLLMSLGTSESAKTASAAQVKLIEVRPGGVLSLQKHARRAEHWVVTRGIATVELDGEMFDCQVGEHVFIPVGAVHRMSNRSDAGPLSVVEVQVGDYLGEDDIVRLDDIYGRVHAPVQNST